MLKRNRCNHEWKLRDDVESCVNCGAVSKFPPIRIIKSVLFFGMFGQIVHEFGHIFMALSQGRVVTEAVFFGAYPYIMSTPASISLPLDIIQSLSGIAVLPLYLWMHKGALGKFMPYELLIITLISIGGTMWDFNKILWMLGLVGAP